MSFGLYATALSAEWRRSGHLGQRWLPDWSNESPTAGVHGRGGNVDGDSNWNHDAGVSLDLQAIGLEGSGQVHPQLPLLDGGPLLCGVHHPGILAAHHGCTPHPAGCNRCTSTGESRSTAEESVALALSRSSSFSP
jgi:hypothetical protein